ncbi:MAG: methyltransferase domain-containing protein, partial [Actinobacteria bacterium]|nr:methyltransferase domain-containing protein [Actinomycetota bacterium]
VSGMVRIVRDDPLDPDPGYAELYASLPDETDLEPWLSWCRGVAGPVLYLGIGTGRLAVPLRAAGVELVGVDAHPGMLEVLESRLRGLEVVQARIEDLELGRRFGLVMAPSGILCTDERLASAARHSGGLVAIELINPYWLLSDPVSGVRVRTMTRELAEIEVRYEQGFVQLASVDLVWPDAIEAFLAGQGLELEIMTGQGLADSSSFFVLASRSDAGAGNGSMSRHGP